MLSFNIGEVYFEVYYKDIGLTRPIICSYEYVGVNDYPPESPEERKYIFIMLNAFCDDEDDPESKPDYFFFDDEYAARILNIESLLAELKEKTGESRGSFKKHDEL